MTFIDVPLSRLSFQSPFGKSTFGRLCRSQWSSSRKTWEEAVADLVSVVPNFPQTACSGLPKSLQQEWQFVQRVTKGGVGGHEFANVELAPQDFPAGSLWK
jgi:hypothetical protein